MIGEPCLHRQAVHTGDHQLRLAAFEHLPHQPSILISFCTGRP
jgi:hypothetical protein